MGMKELFRMIDWLYTKVYILDYKNKLIAYHHNEDDKSEKVYEFLFFIDVNDELSTITFNVDKYGYCFNIRSEIIKLNNDYYVNFMLDLNNTISTFKKKRYIK